MIAKMVMMMMMVTTIIVASSNVRSVRGKDDSRRLRGVEVPGRKTPGREIAFQGVGAPRKTQDAIVSRRRGARALGKTQRREIIRRRGSDAKT